MKDKKMKDNLGFLKKKSEILYHAYLAGKLSEEEYLSWSHELKKPENLFHWILEKLS